MKNNDLEKIKKWCYENGTKTITINDNGYYDDGTITVGRPTEIEEDDKDCLVSPDRLKKVWENPEPENVPYKELIEFIDSLMEQKISSLNSEGGKDEKSV